MTFLNPILVSVGIASIAIPIVIHILMRRRRRPVAWGAMKFLMEAYRQQRRRTRLEQLLLLASRCLLIALVALALGKPVLGALAGSGSGGPRTLYLVIDDSLSSRARTTTDTSTGTSDTTGLDRSRTRALEVLATLSQSRGDRVAIITTGSPARALILPPTGDLSAATETLRQIQPTDARADWSGALTLVREDQSQDRARQESSRGALLLVLSEFRGAIDPARALPTLAQPATATAAQGLTLLASTPSTTSLPNTAIRSLDPTRSLLVGSAAGSEVEARVTLLRSTAPGTLLPAESVRVRLRAIGGDSEIGAGESSVAFAEGQTTASTILRATIRTLPARGSRVVLEARLDPASGGVISRDDAFVTPLESRDRLEVALIAPGPLSTSGTAADFTPADWAALALSPGSAIASRRRDEGEIRVALVEPRAVGGEGGSLSEFDAAWIVAPDQLSAAGWRAVANVASRGGLILVSPPATAQTHAWPDAMNEALGLSWTIARTATEFTPRASLSQNRGGWSGPDLLEVVAAELPELVRPIRISRALNVTRPVTGPADTASRAGAFDTLLTIEPDATSTSKATLPLLVVARADANTGPDTDPAANLATFASGTNASSGTSSAGGLVALLTVAPDLTWTDLPAKPLMVPLVQELVRQGIGRSMASRITAAGQAPLLPPGTRDLAPVRIALLDEANERGNTSSNTSNDSANDAGSDSAASLAVAAGVLDQPIRRAGLFLARDTSGATLAPISFVADSEASNTAAMPKQDAERWLGSTGLEPRWLDDDTNDTTAESIAAAAVAASADSSGSSGSSPMSTFLLMLAGLIAIAELGMARYFSHAQREDRA